jgi:uracil DNA glycosylase
MEKYKAYEAKMGSWAPHFRPFIESDEIDKIYEVLRTDSLEGTKKTLGKRVLPYPKDTFRAFSTCDKHNIKVIFYLMDPYPRLYKNGEPQATGIAMDCSNTPDGKLQPSLVNFYDALSKEIGKKVDYSPSLEYLQEQGVMFLNTDLTVRLEKTGSHEGLWLPFQKFFLEQVMSHTTGIIYVLCGKASYKMEKFIYPVSNYIFRREHPSAAQYSNGEWQSDNIFNTINSILQSNNKEKIFWDRKEWEEYKTPPF